MGCDHIVGTLTEKPARRRPLTRVIDVVGRLAVLPTILGCLATLGACGAQLAWPLELLCHFRVQYAVTLLLLSGLLLAARRHRWVVVALAGLGINAWWIAPLLPYASVAAPSVTPSVQAVLNLVVINVFSGNSTPERAVEFLRAADADVIIVAEVTHDWERRLAALTATHPHQAVQSSAGNFGIALYSRYPLEDVKFLPLSEHNDAVTAQVNLPGADVRVLGAHPLPPLGPFSSLRNGQLKRLAEYASGYKEPTVVAGDLNITPFSPYFDRLLTESELRDPRRGQGLLTTWPSERWLLRIPIDHCLVSESIVARLSVGPDVGSDHRPLIAELNVARPSRR